jgi:hypothetical protein
MVAFPTPARAATPSIDIWWKPTVFRSLYVASRIAFRDTSLRLRPCTAVVDGAAANGDTPDHFETSRFTTRGIFSKHCGFARRRSLRRCAFSVTAARQVIPSPWIWRGSPGGSLLRPLRGEVAGACDHREGTSGGLQDRPSATANFHDFGDLIRDPATTDSCDTSEGDPEGSPFAFTDVFY